MQSKDVKDTVSFWTEWASKPEVKRYDIALFKVWIKFERFAGSMFLDYSLGKCSETGYAPNLKIKFQDEEQFNAFMREKGKKYIDYFDRIENLSKHIFADNPFDALLYDANIQSALGQITALRNYTAHESEEAKSKVIKTCFGNNEKRFIEPNAYLQKKEKTTQKSYYTYYTEIILAIVEKIIG